MLILYGSQTGNAQEVAESLATEAMARGIDCCALPMDCIAVSEMSVEAAIVFVCSTTGARAAALLPSPGIVAWSGLRVAWLLLVPQNCPT